MSERQPACVIYTRFSPRRNARESESCETQEAQCREHAAAQGWKVVAVRRDEAVSGKAVDKPGLSAALADLGRGDVLLVYRRDRIARDVLLAELVRRQVRSSGARIVAVHGDPGGDDDGPEATFVRQILDAVAELERKLIGARTRAAMRTQQAAGKRVGRFPPYGYMIDPCDPTRIVRDPREATALAAVRELVAEGLPTQRVARLMDERFPDACRGKRWSRRTIKKIAERG